MKILQFGTGRFLRGFLEPIFEEPASVTVVQSRLGSNGASLINAAGDGFHVWTRGKSAGKIIDTYEVVRSIDRALVSQSEWTELQEFVLDPQLRLIASNTTEKGLALDPIDTALSDTATCPQSFPAKIASLLFWRYREGLPGLALLPTELLEGNGDLLRRLVIEQAKTWRFTNDDKFVVWLNEENRWLNNLVDRITVSVSDATPWGTHDPLAVVVEPYRLLAIADDGRDHTVLPTHAMVKWVDNLEPFFERKVRILNGLHTAMVAHSLPAGFETVVDVLNNSEQRLWLQELLNEEILPLLRPRIDGVDTYAAEVIERFENPFFQHRLQDIAVNHAMKLQTRLRPLVDEYAQRFGKAPRLLSEILE